MTDTGRSLPVSNRCGGEMIAVEVIGKCDDLSQLVEEINSASWDDANEMPAFAAAWRFAVATRSCRSTEVISDRQFR